MLRFSGLLFLLSGVLLAQGGVEATVLGTSNLVLRGHTCAGSADTNTVTTSAIDTRGADFVVAAITSSATTTGAVTLSDSVSSGTITKLTAQGPDNDSAFGFLAYILNITTNSAYTFTATATGKFPAVCIAAFSNIKTTSAFGTQNGAVGAFGTTFQPGSITPGKATDLVIAGLGPGVTSGTLSINSGFTITDQIAGAGGMHYAAVLAYLKSPTGAAVNPTWTDTGSSGAAATIATFGAQ